MTLRRGRKRMRNALISQAVKPSAEDRICRVLVSRSAFLLCDLRSRAPLLHTTGEYLQRDTPALRTR